MQGDAPVVGRLAAVFRYPVKSMAAESVDAADVSWHGVAGDRRWAFVRAGRERSGFPWLTLRHRNDLNGYRPAFADPAQPDSSATLVSTPSGAVLDVQDPALAAELADGLQVMKLDRGTFDSAPLSLITTRTVDGIGALLDAGGSTGLDVRRFRPNLLVEPVGPDPFPEDAWVGRTLRIGPGLLIRVDRRDKRCLVVNIDPLTARRDPAVLRAIARERDVCLGVYGATVRPGRVAVGDPVRLESA